MQSLCLMNSDIAHCLFKEFLLVISSSQLKVLPRLRTSLSRKYLILFFLSSKFRTLFSAVELPLKTKQSLLVQGIYPPYLTVVTRFNAFSISITNSSLEILLPILSFSTSPISRPKSLPHVILHSRWCPSHITPIQRPQHTIHIPIKEVRNAVAILASSVNHTMQRALVASRCPHLQHVAYINDKSVRVGYYINPYVVCVVPYLKTADLILQKQGDGTEVCVCSCSESGIC